jgi:hypothetical protein
MQISGTAGEFPQLVRRPGGDASGTAGDERAEAVGEIGIYESPRALSGPAAERYPC